MANPSVQSSSKLFDNAAITSYFHVPGSTSALITTPDGTTKKMVSMASYNAFAVVATAAVLAGAGITLLEIVASEDSAGATNLQVIKSSGAIAANSLGSKVVLECTSEEMTGATAGGKPLYIAARITMANSGDKAAVTYIRSEPRFRAAALTANSIATVD